MLVLFVDGFKPPESFPKDLLQKLNKPSLSLYYDGSYCLGISHFLQEERLYLSLKLFLCLFYSDQKISTD